MGGQTGLNLAKNMAESGMLDKYGVELIGAKLPSIDRAEDRELFKQAMQRIGLKTPPRWAARCNANVVPLQPLQQLHSECVVAGSVRFTTASAASLVRV
jgi:carbamoylphosphate synthase large subunit